MFGETLGKVRSSYYDDPQGRDAFRTQAYGSMFDVGYSYVQNKKDQAAMEEIAQLERQVAETQLNIAAQSAADEAAYRARILERIGDMDTSLKSSLAKLGPRAQVDGDDIAKNYQTFKSSLMDDYYDTVDLVASGSKASAIRRGMDRSTQFSDEQAALISKSADQIPGIHQAAFDAAINRSKQFADSVNSGRQGTFDELTNVLGKAATMETSMITNNAGTNLNNAATTLQNFGNRAGSQYDDSQTVMGDTVASFNEKIAPNFGYGFGNRANYSDPAASMEQRQLAAYRNALGGDKADAINADLQKTAG